MEGESSTGRPSHYYIDEKWDAAIDTALRRVVYGSLAGGVAALLLFRACAPLYLLACFQPWCGINSLA